MSPETLSAPTNENEVSKEQLRGQAKDIGEKVLDESLQQKNIARSPEGYLTINGICKQYGSNYRMVLKVLNALQMKGDIFIDKAGKRAVFYSPAQIQGVLDYLKAEKAPEGYLTANSFAEMIGVGHNTIDKKVRELSIIGTKYGDERGVVCTFLSPEQQQQIRESLGYLLNTEKVPDGYLTVRSFAKKINVAKETVKKRIKKLKIEGTKFKDERGIICSFLSPEQQQIILDHMNDDRVDAGEEPDGYATARQLAEKIGVDKATVGKKMKELQIEGAKYRNRRDIVRIFLSPEQQQQIRESLDYLLNTEIAPDGYATARQLAEKIGVNKETVKKRIKESQIEGAKYKDKRGGINTFYSPEQQQQIRELFDYEMHIDSAPEGFLTADAFARVLNVGWDVVKTRADDLQIKGTEYKDKRGLICTFLSPEQQQQIRDSLDYLLQTEKAPDGYLTARSFAKTINVDKATVGKRIKELQIEGTEYKDKRGALCTFLSPEQQSIILESLESMEAGTSIPENTVAFYFEKAGYSFKQGLRPDWLKNPNSKRNLEVDIFVDSFKVGIEYDGSFYHQDVGRDVTKDIIARENGYTIIHIRENGCPDLLEDSICIKRRDNYDDVDLGECIEKCFQLLNVPAPDIDVARDKKDIMAFMRQRVLDKLDAATVLEELSVVS